VETCGALHQTAPALDTLGIAPKKDTWLGKRAGRTRFVVVFRRIPPRGLKRNSGYGAIAASGLAGGWHRSTREVGIRPWLWVGAFTGRQHADWIFIRDRVLHPPVSVLRDGRGLLASPVCDPFLGRSLPSISCIAARIDVSRLGQAAVQVSAPRHGRVGVDPPPGLKWAAGQARPVGPSSAGSRVMGSASLTVVMIECAFGEPFRTRRGCPVFL